MGNRKPNVKIDGLKSGDRIRASDWATPCFGQKVKTVELDDDGTPFVQCYHGRHYLDGHENADGLLEGLRRAR